jgi:hypothetical protein
MWLVFIPNVDHQKMLLLNVLSLIQKLKNHRQMIIN